MSVIKFIRDIARYFKYPSDDNPTTQQDYQNAVKNWVATETSLVDTILWQPKTSYAVGAMVKTPSIASRNVLYCVTAGVSGTAEPSYGGKTIGDSVNDGTVVWEICSVMPFIASKSVGGHAPIRLYITGNDYKGIEASHADGNKVGVVRFSRKATYNEATLGVSDGNNNPPTGLTVYRELNNDFTYLKSTAQGLSTSRSFFNFYLNTSNPASAVEAMQLNSSSLNIGGKALNNASNIFLNGTGHIYGYKTSGAFTLYCGSDNINPSMTFWGVNSPSSAGYFRIRATLDGSNNKDLVGRPSGELTWNSKNVLTDATVGNYTSKDIENAINLSASTARNITNVSLSAGRWLVIGAAKFGDVTASRIYGIQLGTTSGAYYYANSGSVAAHSTNTGALSLQTVHIFNLSATTTIYLTGYATAACSVDNAAVQAIRIV